jgi:transcriptional regulator with XRE-family HTH domain
MARAALKIGVRELAVEADVAPMTISRYENEHGGMQATTRDRVQAVLEAKGIAFEVDDGRGPGVRYRRVV